jgi:carbamoyl-phosphate synthase small subunit
MTPRRGFLVTSDGEVFAGTSVGADGVATGEVVFNTAMTGYQEIATDPSYAGQVVVMTAPHIGNYGTSNLDDQATHPFCTGFVMRSISRRPSNWRSEIGFSEWLNARNVVALSDIDTRRLTRHIRERGAMPVALGSGTDVAELAAQAAAAPTMEGRDLVSEVTTDRPYVVAPAAGLPRRRIVAYDFGMKRDIVDALTGRGFEVHVVPASTSAAETLAQNPDGVFLSNGPGDPEAVVGAVAAVRGLLGSVPVFGICLGHQILGLALGATTYKLPFGHHGGNHPVRRMEDGSVEITAQNHGFAVDLWSLTNETRPAGNGMPGPDQLPAAVETEFGRVVPTHQNLNDGTLEGLACRDIPAFSVQYHPEAAPGPNDAERLFDHFVDVLGRL